MPCGLRHVCVASQLPCSHDLLPRARCGLIACSALCCQPLLHDPCSRTRRLRVLLRLLESPVSQRALRRFWKGTLLLCAIILVAHVACYAVLGTQVLERHT